MKTSGQNHLKVFIVTFLMCIIQAKGAVLSITTNPVYSRTTGYASLTCSISPFTLGAEWIKNKTSLTQCLSGSCIPPFSTRYQYSANATSITVTIASPDVAQDETTWTCAYNSGADVTNYNLTVYSTPSANLAINGPTSSAVNDNVTVHLSVSTGCIHPSGPEYYSIMWKYVEAGTTAEKVFETGITQNFTSVGGCSNDYDNLILNLYFTNKMNTGTTTLSITQVKMIFTMAEIISPASLNVSYNVTGTGTTPTTSSPNDNKAKEIGGGVAGAAGAAGAGGAAGAAIYWYKKNKKKKNRKAADGEDCEAQNDGENNDLQEGVVKNETGKSEPKHSMSDVSRNDVDVQMEEKGVKSNEERN